MDGASNALKELVDLLVGGVTDLGGGIGAGANEFLTDLFLRTSESGAIEGLSAFGATVGIFGGVSLAIGLTTLVFSWVRSLGN